MLAHGILGPEEKMSLVFDRFQIGEFVEHSDGFCHYRGLCADERVSIWISDGPLGAAQRGAAESLIRDLAGIDHPNLPTVYALHRLGKAMEFDDHKHPVGSLFFVVQEIPEEVPLAPAAPWAAIGAILRGLTTLHAAGLVHGALDEQSLRINDRGACLWGMSGLMKGPCARGIAAMQEDLKALSRLADAWVGKGLDRSQATWLEGLANGGIFANGGEALRRAKRWLPEEPVVQQAALRARQAGAGLHALRPIALQGRDAELAMLDAALEGAEREEAVFTVVMHGPPGSGRTHLCRQFCESMSLQGRAMVLHAVHGPFPTPMDGIAGALAKCFGVDPLNLEETIGFVAAGIEGLGLREDEHRAGIEAFVREHIDKHAFAPRQPFTRFALLKGFLQSLSANRPIILWVDDAQWGSDILDFCEFLREKDDGIPILILLAVREGWPSEVIRGAAGVTVPRQGPRTLWMSLGSLSMPACLSIGSQSLGLEEDLAALLAGGSRGIPLVAAQAAILWGITDLLESDGQQLRLKGSDLPVLKSGARQIWAARLEACIGEEEEDLFRLELASAFGAHVDPGLWATACKQASLGDPDELIHRMLDAGLLRTGLCGLSFAHETFKSYLDHSAEREGRRLDQHKACAKALMSAGRTGTAQYWERIGRHLLAGGQGEASLSALKRAARLHGERANYESALGLLVIRDKVMRDLGIDERDERWGHGRVLRAGMLRGMGRLDEAARIADSVVEEAQANRWKEVMPYALRGLALVALEMEDISSAGTLLRRARELFSVAGDDGAIAICAHWQGRVLLRRGNQATAERFFLEASTLFEDVQDEQGQAESLYWVGVVQRQQGKLEDSLSALMLAESHFVRLGNALGEADCKLARGLVWLYREDMETSEGLQEEALLLHQRLHNDVGAADCLNGLAEVARHRGDLVTAEKNYRNAAAIFSSARGSRAVLPQVNLALVLIQRNENDSARRLLETIAPTIDRQGKRALLGAVHSLFLVLCAEEEGAVSWARHYRQANSLLRETGAVDPDIAWAAQTGAERAASAGHLGRARQAYELAHDQWTRLNRDDNAEAVTRAILD